jgi:indole-3-acetate monooxygenase
MGTQLSSLDAALSAVAAVAPIAREHAPKAEDIRHLPVEVVDAMEEAGLWSVFTPREVGGSGLAGLGEQFEIIRAMAYEDASAGWALFISGGTPMLIGSKLPPAGRAEVFAGGVVPMAGVFNPGGSGATVDGGLRVSGKWPFASGIGHAGWVMANVIVVDESGAPRPGVGGLPEIRSVIVPRDDVTVIDDWYVAGLRGTGSMSFAMDGVVVPEHRTFAFFGPCAIDEAKYRLPLFTIVAPAFMGMAVGLAQRAIDEVVALLPTKVGPPTFQPASADAVTQSKVGRAITSVNAARESTGAILGRIDERVERGEDLTELALADRLAVRQHAVWVAETCVAAVNDLFRLGGASSIYDSGILQRLWRDTNVVGQHLFLRPSNFEIAGKTAFGIDADTPFV